MTENSISEILDGVKDTLIKKNKMYGGASFDLGVTGNMVHIWDKARRYRTLVELDQARGNKEEHERAKKLVADIENYISNGNCNISEVESHIKTLRGIIDNMGEEEAKVHFESIEDTLRDIIGYAVIGLHILQDVRK